MSATPLRGLRVLEFSHTVMGPTAGLILAELGADVIKVEPVPKGDHTRGLGGFAAGFFAAFSRNKRSLAVDLKKPEGQAVIRALVPSDGHHPGELRPWHDGTAGLRVCPACPAERPADLPGAERLPRRTRTSIGRHWMRWCSSRPASPS